MAGLSPRETMKIVNRYIGVSQGYLGDFSYRTHREFYPEYCDLPIDPEQYEGTTRERFIQTLENAVPGDQAKILRGLVERFPVGDPDAPATRTEQLRDQLLARADELEKSNTEVVGAIPVITSDVVSLAIADAEELLKTTGATSGVDRLHTVLHGYLMAVCDDAGITYPAQAINTKLLKLIRSQHPKLQSLGPRSQDIERVLQSCAAILDAMNPLRNSASVAHPNPVLLGDAEARLVINASRTVLAYLDAKLSS